MSDPFDNSRSFFAELKRRRVGPGRAYDLQPDGGGLVLAQTGTVTGNDSLEAVRVVLVTNFFEEFEAGGAGLRGLGSLGVISQQEGH